jgi:hypothetical protein
MADTFAASERSRTLPQLVTIQAIVFAPFFALWTVFVLLMLPVTILAVPAHRLLRHRPETQCGFVLALVVFGAINALLGPVFLVYALWI